MASVASSPLTVRFLENDYYDIELDVDVVKMMAITGTGTWCAEAPRDKQLYSKRKAFKEWVVDQMEQGVLPCEVDLDDD